jgi:hypothetical protein
VLGRAAYLANLERRQFAEDRGLNVNGSLVHSTCPIQLLAALSSVSNLEEERTKGGM